MDRRDLGRQEYTALIGSAPEQNLAELRSSSPQLYEAVVEEPSAAPWRTSN